jgi:hypothetical protein
MTTAEYERKYAIIAEKAFNAVLGNTLTSQQAENEMLSAISVLDKENGN